MLIANDVWWLLGDFLSKQSPLIAIITALLSVILFSTYAVSLLYKSYKSYERR